MGCYINIDKLFSYSVPYLDIFGYILATQYLRFYSIVLLASWDLVDNEEGAPASISNIGNRAALWFFPQRLIKECQRLVGPISVSGQSTWGPKAGNASAGNPTTYTMDDDDAVEASAPLPRKGGASAGKGHLFLAGFKLYNSICRRLSKTCFLCKNRITLE